MANSTVRLTPACFPSDLDHVSRLLTEYREESPHEICFRSFDRELSELIDQYSAPQGGILLATLEQDLAGCVGWWCQTIDVCEMRRLFVRSMFRKHGLGRQLVEALIDEVRNLGYRQIELHTLPAMASAVKLYRSMGFRQLPAKSQAAGEPVYFRFDLG